MKITQTIINNYLKGYLIGPMESVKKDDEGTGWRLRLKPELEKRIDSNGNPVFVFDPTLYEKKKVGETTREFHKNLDGWLASGQRDKVKESMDIIWKGKTIIETDENGNEELTHIMGDTNYVRYSDFLILHIGEGDSPCGTYGEAYLGYLENIPIYMIQTMPLKNYSKTLLGWVLGSGGDIFPNQKQLLEFIDKKYNLKVRKDS